MTPLPLDFIAHFGSFSARHEAWERAVLEQLERELRECLKEVER